MFKSVFKTGIRGAYNIADNAAFSTDLWVIYPAKHKQTGKMVSVFIFEKPRFEAQVHRVCSTSVNTSNALQIVLEFYEQIRADISNLTKLKHPQILTVLEAIEETKLKFLFVSEPVSANLATLNMEHETPLSIQKGLLEVSKGLQFLHTHCSIIHMNLQPSSVFVNTQSDWKLAGFKFLQNLNEMSPLDRENYYIMNSSSVVESANHNLNFTAPELILDLSGLRLGTANDMWSLGMLIFYLYNKGDHMINCFEANNVSDFKAEFRKFEQKFYNHRPAELRYMFKEVPEPLWAIMTQLLARYPHDRLSADQFIDSDFFDGSLIKMMWFIDEFTTKAVTEKVIFLDGLLGHSDLLAKLPDTFRNLKLLPLLVESIKSESGFLQTKKLDADMDAFLSKSLLFVFAIGELLSSLSFQDRIYAELLDSAKGRKSASSFNKLFPVSVKIRLAIITNTPLLLKKLQEKQTSDLMKECATLCVTASKNELDQQADQILLQDTYLRNLSLVVHLFDFPYVKNSLFPLLCQVFKTTTILSTKIQTIETFDMLIAKKIIDKVIVNDQLLPVLESLKSRDKRIVRALIAFFVRLSTSNYIGLDLDVLVDKVFGQCLRLVFRCLDYSKGEFQELMGSLATIQNAMAKEKLSTLSDSPRDPAKENFSSLLDSALVRQRAEEPAIKAPVLSPISSSSRPANSPSNVQSMPRVKPMVLTPSFTQTQGLRFGATRMSSNTETGKLVSALRVSLDSSSHDGEGTIAVDWSSAESSLNVPSTTVNSTVLRHVSTPLRTQGSSWASLKASSGFGVAKLPPGFSTDTILTPNATGVSLLPLKTQKNSEDFLNFF